MRAAREGLLLGNGVLTAVVEPHHNQAPPRGLLLPLPLPVTTLHMFFFFSLYSDVMSFSSVTAIRSLREGLRLGVAVHAVLWRHANGGVVRHRELRSLMAFSSLFSIGDVQYMHACVRVCAVCVRIQSCADKQAGRQITR